MPRYKKTRLYFLLAILTAGLCFSLPSFSVENINIWGVFPFKGLLGQNLPVTISGQGITEATRVSMSLDVKSATVGSVSGRCLKAEISENTAFLCTVQDFKIYDVKYPSNPVFLGSITTPDRPVDIAISGTMAYVVDISGLQIIDVQNLNHPVLKGYVPLSGMAWSISLSGNTAYVAARNGGLHIVNVTNPDAPSLLSTCTQTPDASDVTVRDHIAYVADCSDLKGLYAVDVSNPSAPEVLKYIPTEGAANSVTLSGQYAFVSEDKGLKVIDIHAPATPTLVGSLATDIVPIDTAIKGTTAYVLDYTYGEVLAVDIHDPEHPQVLWSVATTGGTCMDIDTSGDHAYVAGTTLGFHILDISKAPADMSIGKIDGDNIRDIAIQGDIAYVADQEKGLLVIDVHDPAHPVLSSTLDTPGTTFKLAVKGALVCIADGEGGVQIVDISNSQQPAIIGNIPLTDGASVCFVDDVLLASDWSNGLYAININDPTHPVITGHITLPGYASGMFVSDNKAYVTAWTDGLHIVDISDPANMVLKGSVMTPGYSYNVWVEDSTAFVADRNKGVQIINIADPSAPKIISAIATPGVANNVIKSGKWLYASCSDRGLQMFDVENPEHPVLAGYVNTEGYTWAISLKNNMAFIADGNAGMVITPLPVAITPDKMINTGNLLATILSPLLAGDYKIHLLNPDGLSPTSYRVTFEAGNGDRLSGAVAKPSDKGGCFIETVRY